MKATEIEPGTYYVVRLSGGELDNVRAERVEVAYPGISTTKVMIATRHFALGDRETRHALRDVLQRTTPERVAKLKRFVAARDKVLDETAV